MDYLGVSGPNCQKPAMVRARLMGDVVQRWADEMGRSLHVVCAESVCREPRAEARLPILLMLPPLLLPSSYVYGAHRKLSVCRSLSQSGNKGECSELHWL